MPPTKPKINKLLLSIFIIVLLGGGIYFFLKNKTPQNNITLVEQTQVVKNSETTENPDAADTLEIKGLVAVFRDYTPAEVEKFSKENEEEFSTAADDKSFYESQAVTFLEKKGVTFISTDKRYLQFVKNDGKKVLIDRYALPKEHAWDMYFFDGKQDPKTADYVGLDSLSAEYEKYFK